MFTKLTILNYINDWKVNKEQCYNKVLVSNSDFDSTVFLLFFPLTLTLCLDKTNKQ